MPTMKDRINHYWQKRGVKDLPFLQYHGKTFEYCSFTGEKTPDPFQFSYVDKADIPPDKSWEPFQRLNGKGNVKHFLYTPDPWERYTGKPLYIVEGVPDALTLRQAGKFAVGVRSKGVIFSAMAEIQTLVTFASVTKIIVIPDPDGWDLWCHAFKTSGLTQKHLSFIKLPKDVNDLWKNDRENFNSLLAKKTLHNFDVQARYDIDAINAAYSPFEIKEYLCKALDTTARKDGKQWRIENQGGLFVSESGALSIPDRGKGHGGHGILSAMLYAKTGRWKRTDPKIWVEILQEAADMTNVSPAYQAEARREPSSHIPHPADITEPPQEQTTTGENPPEFWKYVEVKKGKFAPKLHRKQFLTWLEASGFGMLMADKRLKFVRIQDHIVSECLIEHGQNIDVKRYTLEYCREQHLDDVEEMLLTGQNQYFTLSALNALQFFTPDFNRDTQTSAFFYFHNVFIEVQRNSVEVKPYSALTGCIWDSQKLAYTYNGIYSNGEEIPLSPTGEFCEFLLRVTASHIEEDRSDYTANDQKMFAFIAAYGYLLYGWKDVTESKAVICVDNSLGDIDDDGRTGKSLFCESLKHLKRVHTEAGKTWNPEDRFAYQNVSLDTQIIYVDDITRKFAFKALYPSITGDLSCEGKGLKKMVLPFAESPKFVITTNTPVKGEGGSDRARQCILPFSKYFYDGYTPKDLFGHRLFVDWEESDWQQFFDLGIFAVNYYLKNGLLDYEDPMLNEAKLRLQVPEQAVDFFGNLDRDVEYDKHVLKKSAEDFGLTFHSSHAFTRWLKIYCKHWRGTADNPETLHYVERRTRVESLNVTYITFHRTQKT